MDKTRPQFQGKRGQQGDRDGQARRALEQARDKVQVRRGSETHKRIIQETHQLDGLVNSKERLWNCFTFKNKYSKLYS